MPTLQSMRTSAISLAVVALLLAVGCRNDDLIVQPAPEDSCCAMIRIVVVDSRTDQPLRGVSLSLFKDTDSLSAGTTDVDGMKTFATLCGAKYNVVSEKAGFDNALRSIIIVGDCDTAQITIAMNVVKDSASAPGNFRASSRSATAITLAWDATSSALDYNVSWNAVAPELGAGSILGITSNTIVVTGLTVGVTYDLSVSARSKSGRSKSARINWAPASRPALTGDNKPIRMYEFESTNPGGLNLNIGGAPMQVAMRLGTPNKAQLAMFVYDTDPGTSDIDSLIIGPASALIEYPAAHDPTKSKIDTSVCISQTTYDVTSLDTWYLNTPLDALIDPNSNFKAYSIRSNNSMGQGFVVRTGEFSAFHYARVVIKAVGGLLVSGSYPNRYIELEVSYQHGLGVPFAKTSSAPSAGVVATRVKRRVIEN